MTAKVIETVERDGHTINIYESGAEYDTVDKRLVKPASHTLLTTEKRNLYQQQRLEKTAALIRRRITDETAAVATLPVRGSVQAVAYAAGQLWSEIVLNDTAYPRDRMDAWEKIGKFAQVLPDGKRAADEPAEPVPTEFVNALSGLVRELASAIGQRVNGAIDGQLIETPVSASQEVDE